VNLRYSLLLSLIGLSLFHSWPVRASPSLECTGSSQVEIKDCLVETEHHVNRALATALRIARDQAAGLDAVTGRAVAVPALEEGQAAWLAYRDAHCDYHGATFGGGSGTGIAIRNCRIALTRQRTDELVAAAH
jgi:uncharacterized protein YecT (DUF1311 family)